MSSQVSTQATRRELNARQAETVGRVTEAALGELRDVGFEALTVRGVAGRASVAPATAYTYFSSKSHLVAEAFWRRLASREHVELDLPTPLERVVAVFEDLARFLSGEPELAAAATPAMLGADPEVRRLRVLIGTEIQDRLAAALGDDADPVVLDALGLAWNGAMLQAGMGHTTYEQMGQRLAAVARVVMGERS